MKENIQILPPEMYGKSGGPWSELELKLAIKTFRQKAPVAPIPRLYEAYRWLKTRIDSDDDRTANQFTYFVEILLGILEERGAAGSEIYTEVLRDSAEYRYLKGLFHSEPAEPEPPLKEDRISDIPQIAEEKKITLKEILSGKNRSLLDCDINVWHRLLDEHMKEFTAEELFVKNLLPVINSVKKREDKEIYHVEIIIVYAFDRFMRFKTLSLRTKDFAMQLLNLMTDRGEIWGRLHREYLEIIKK